MNERIRELIAQAGMTVKDRRPLDHNNPNGYMESDFDYVDNNIESIRVFFNGGVGDVRQVDCSGMCWSVGTRSRI